MKFHWYLKWWCLNDFIYLWKQYWKPFLVRSVEKSLALSPAILQMLYFSILCMEFQMERSTWYNTKSLPLNSPRPSSLLATSQTHWASWAQCWVDTPPELCWSSVSRTAAQCGETSPPAGRRENGRVTFAMEPQHNQKTNIIYSCS